MVHRSHYVIVGAIVCAVAGMALAATGAMLGAAVVSALAGFGLWLIVLMVLRPEELKFGRANGQRKTIVLPVVLGTIGLALGAVSGRPFMMLGGAILLCLFVPISLWLSRK